MRADWKFRLAVDDRTAVGVYPIRVVTEAGASNPILFAVGQVAQAAEIEPNNTFDGAQPIANPSVVEGECSGNDEDFFRFKGRKDMRDRRRCGVLADRLGSRPDDPADDSPTVGSSPPRTIPRACSPTGTSRRSCRRTATTCWNSAIRGSPARAGRSIACWSARSRSPARLYPMALPRGQLAAIELRGGTLSGDRLFALRTPPTPYSRCSGPTIPARLLGDPAWADSDLDVELPAPVPLDQRDRRPGAGRSRAEAAAAVTAA